MRNRISRRPLNTEIAAPASLTAATTPIDAHKLRPGSSITSGTAWSKAAWDYYDSVGELRYVCGWLANSLSRATLIASDVNPMTGQPTGSIEDEEVAQIVADIAGGPAGQSQMLGRLATFLTVPGDGWVAVIVRETTTGEVEEWHVLSSEEITRRGTDIYLSLADGDSHKLNPERDILTRVHRPHPRNAREADSPVRAALPILAEIVAASQTIAGSSKSRLAGNGILLLPQEISMPVAQAPTPDPDAPGLTPEEPYITDAPVSANDVMQQLQEVMTTAISDQTSAAALVPIVLKAPGDTLDKIRHIKLSSDLPSNALETRDKAIHRLAMSLDIPPEILTGLSVGNHWSAWKIDETALNTHIAPMLTLICDALTDAVLRPLLRAQNHPNPDSVTIWYDATALATSPDRTDHATTAYEKGVITGDAYRRELGFDTTDAPTLSTTEERTQYITELILRRPELLPALGPEIGIHVPPNTTITPSTTNAPTSPPQAQTPQT